MKININIRAGVLQIMVKCMNRFQNWIRLRWKKILICFIAALILSVCLEALQILTQPKEYEEVEGVLTLVRGGMVKKRIAILTIILFVVFWLLHSSHIWMSAKGNLASAQNSLTENKRKTGRNIFLFVSTGGAIYGLLRIFLPYYLNKPFNPVLNVFSICIALVAGTFFCFRKTLGEKPEVFFLIICISLGSLLAVYYPAAIHIAWDDDYHFKNAIKYSYLGNTKISKQDEIALSSWAGTEYIISEQETLHKEQNKIYKEGDVDTVYGMPEYKNYWLFFSGIGLYFGRVFQMPYHWIVSMGRLFGLLTYAVIGYFAIKRLKYGKMILAAVLLIPENIFLASSFHYDPSVTVFIALGFSYLIREWQEPEKVIQWKNAWIMIVALTAGCITKAVYFPILLLPLFLKKNKFTDRKQHRWFILLSLSAMFLLIVSFVLPFVFSDGTGDTRGGAEVNSFLQVKYILKNPLEYALTLFRYFRNNMTPDDIKYYSTFFAFMGMGPNYSIYLIALVFVAFTDRNGTELNISGGVQGRVISLIILFIAYCFVGTSMYISYTPVGLNTIHGFQPRYVLPLFFPAMMLIGSGRIKNSANKAAYNGISLAAMAYVGFSVVLALCLNFYV